jgi:hypothetical protein
VIEIEYELNKINVFTKSDEEPSLTGIFTWFLLKILSKLMSSNFPLFYNNTFTYFYSAYWEQWIIFLFWQYVFVKCWILSSCIRKNSLL